MMKASLWAVVAKKGEKDVLVFVPRMPKPNSTRARGNSGVGMLGDCVCRAKLNHDERYLI